jgi:hypothetical protein
MAASIDVFPLRLLSPSTLVKLSTGDTDNLFLFCFADCLIYWCLPTTLAVFQMHRDVHMLLKSH